jgi:predicted enzyme related to lactoylglutathione lyase
MSAFNPNNGNEAALKLPALQRDARGRIDVDSVPDVIQWFLDYDERVAVIKHPRVEEVFQWKQEQSRLAGEEVFNFSRAEDRLAIGIIQALAENSTEPALHSWISQLLNALETASKANEATSESYLLELSDGGSVIQEAAKIPSEQGRSEFLLNCWVETLCTAEARVLGWLYKEFYGHPYAP